MSWSPPSCHHHQQVRSRPQRVERPLGPGLPRRAPKRPDEPGWRRAARRREHSEPVAAVHQTTLVRRCRDFYAQRLRQSEMLRNKWAANPACPQTPSSSNGAQDQTRSEHDDDAASEGEEEGPASTWPRSRFDLAMDSLRKEISCLMERDNALFGQLLGLHQSIAELRLARDLPEEAFTRAAVPDPGTTKPPSRPASLESLASSSSSSEQGGGCRRCAFGQIRRRRALSQAYDSGVQLHYGSSHSESDHEVFV